MAQRPEWRCSQQDARFRIFRAGLYKIWEIPLIWRTTPLPPAVIVNDDDPRINYHRNWRHSGHRGFHDYDDIHATDSPNDFVEFTSVGTGIDYLREKDSSLGNADIYLDGEFQRNVDLCLENFPRFSQVVVFST